MSYILNRFFLLEIKELKLFSVNIKGHCLTYNIPFKQKVFLKENSEMKCLSSEHVPFTWSSKSQELTTTWPWSTLIEDRQFPPVSLLFCFQTRHRLWCSPLARSLRGQNPYRLTRVSVKIWRSDLFLQSKRSSESIIEYFQF